MSPAAHSRQFHVTATTQLGIQFSVIRLYSWPELPKLRQDMVPDVARICALLAVRPTGVPLIHRLVGLPRERVSDIVEMLHEHGHLQESPPAAANDTQHQHTKRLTPEEPMLEQHDTSTSTQTGNGGSIISRLWKRLAGQGS